MHSSPYAYQGQAKRRVWGWALPLLCVVFVILGQVLGLVPLRIYPFIEKENIEQYPQFLYFLGPVFAMIIAVVVVWVKYFEGLTLDSIGLSKPQAGKRFAWGYGLGLAMASVIALGGWALGGYQLENSDLINLNELLIIISLLLAFIVQSSAEEIVFRGWLMGRLHERYGPTIAIWGNTALFSLMHFNADNFHDHWALNLLFLSGLILFSVFLSLYALRTGNVWGACAWHAAWNAIYISGYGLATTGIALEVKPLFVDLMPAESAPVWLNGGSAGPEDSLLCPIVLGAACLWLLFKTKKKQNPQHHAPANS